MAAAPLFNPNAPLYGGEGVSGATPLTAGPHEALGGPPLTGQRVNVIAPNGETISIDVGELATAKERGYSVESAEHAGIRKYVEENKGMSGAAKVAARGFLDEALFGAADPIIDATRDPYELAKWQALKSDHEIANIAGRVGGFGTSLLYGGELFGTASKAGGAAAKILGRGAADAVEHAAGRAVAGELAYRAPTLASGDAMRAGSGIASKILQGAGDFGMQGAVLSSPKAMAQLITGDPDRAAETWMYGAAGGAALGGLAGGVGGVASKLMGRGVPSVATEAAPEVAQAGESLLGTGLKDKAAAKLRKFGDEQAISSLNMTQKFTKRLRNIKGGTEEAARLFREHNLGQYAGEPEALAGAVGGALDDVGGQIGAVYDATGPQKVASFADIENSINKVLGDASKTPGKVGASKSVGRWAEEEILGTLPAEGSTMRELHDLRRVVDKSTRWDPSVSNEVNELRKDIRGALSELIEKKLDSASKDLGRELVAELRPLNKQYSVLKTMSDAAEHNVARGMSVRKHSITDYLGNQIGATVGGFVGGAPGAMVGGYVGGEANNILRRWGPGYLSQGAHTAADMLQGRGLVALEDAFAKNAEQLDHIPRALEAMSAGKVAERAPLRGTIGVNALTHFLEAGNVNLDSNKGLMAFADRLASLSSDPANMQKRIGEAISDISDDSPEVGAIAGTKLAQAASYLHETSPKPPAIKSPFEPNIPWRPTDAQLKEYKTRVKTALDPYSAIDALMDGSLTKAHVETLQALAPRLYEEMIKRVMDVGASGKAKPLPYAQRVRLSILTGAPLDRTLSQLAGYQAAFASPHATEETRAEAAAVQPPPTSDVQRLSA